MKAKRCLEDAYIMGLKTVQEAFWNVHRNSHLYFENYREDMELAELTRHLSNYDNDDLVTDILTKEEMDKLDYEVDENLRKLAEKLE